MHPPAQRAVRRLTAAIAVACLVLLAAACGGGGSDTPSVKLVLRADLSGLPPGVEPSAVLDGLAEALMARANAFGVESVDVKPDVPSQQLTVTIRGFISPEEVRELMEGRGQLDLREPKRDEAGNVVCKGEDGAEFAVAAEDLKYETAESDDRILPRCPVGAKAAGEIVWDGITAGRPEGQEAVPVPIQQSGASVATGGEPVVIIGLTQESGVDLQEVSKGLIGLPMGVFLDDEILVAPTVSEPVVTDKLPIAGLDARRAKLLAARIGPGLLPVPVEVVSEGQNAE